MSSKHVARMLARADIGVDGARPWDMRVHDAAVFRRILLQGSLGLGESYMDGQWDCEALDQLMYRIARAIPRGRGRPGLVTGLHLLRNKLFNMQTRRLARKLAHYDTGNELFARMLDRRMVYTCAYWKDATTLDEAQQAKLDLVCRKIGIRPGMRILDIGCGWGGFMQYAAERHGAECVGYTLSPAQLELGRELCAGLPVEFRLEDYRRMEGSYDAVVSIGMFEAVGRRNYREYMRCARDCLKPDGLFLLHTIGAPGSAAVDAADPWLNRYIFPNGELPGMRQLAEAAEALFVMEDWQNFGADYDRTLMAWHANFEAAWPEFAAHHGERFRRMWRYYLLGCAGLFRARMTQLWQIVFSRKGVVGGYQAPR